MKSIWRTVAPLGMILLVLCLCSAAYALERKGSTADAPASSRPVTSSGNDDLCRYARVSANYLARPQSVWNEAKSRMVLDRDVHSLQGLLVEYGQVSAPAGGSELQALVSGTLAAAVELARALEAGREDDISAAEIYLRLFEAASNEVQRIREARHCW